LVVNKYLDPMNSVCYKNFEPWISGKLFKKSLSKLGSVSSNSMKEDNDNDPSSGKTHGKP